MVASEHCVGGADKHVGPFSARAALQGLASKDAEGAVNAMKKAAAVYTSHRPAGTERQLIALEAV